MSILGPLGSAFADVTWLLLSAFSTHAAYSYKIKGWHIGGALRARRIRDLHTQANRKRPR